MGPFLPISTEIQLSVGHLAICPSWFFMVVSSESLHLTNCPFESKWVYSPPLQGIELLFTPAVILTEMMHLSREPFGWLTTLPVRHGIVAFASGWLPPHSKPVIDAANAICLNFIDAPEQYWYLHRLVQGLRILPAIASQIHIHLKKTTYNSELTENIGTYHRF